MRRIAIFAVFLSLPALAETKMDAVDFLVDRSDLVGKEVTVTGCQIVGANIDNVPCKTGSSIFYIDSPSLDRESLRRALRVCAGFDDLKECEAAVSGLVGKVNNRIGLTKARIIWKDPAADAGSVARRNMEMILGAPLQ